jgi:N-acetylneuraminate synthase
MDENDCKELIEGSNLIWQMRGGTKEPAKEEQVTIDFAFATVVSIKPIKKGEIFTKENVWVKRPGTGEMLAKNFNDILGKTSSKNIEIDTHLNWSDIG